MNDNDVFVKAMEARANQLLRRHRNFTVAYAVLGVAAFLGAVYSAAIGSWLLCVSLTLNVIIAAMGLDTHLRRG